MSINIRYALPEDAEIIAGIKIEVWRTAYKDILSESLLDSFSLRQETVKIEQWISSPPFPGKFYVCYDNGPIVGYAFFARSTDEGDSIGELVFIYIKTECQGKGYGYRLMKKGLEYLKESGCSAAVLWVLSENDNARRFYSKSGWIDNHTERIQLKNGVELCEAQYIIDLKNINIDSH